MVRVYGKKLALLLIFGSFAFVGTLASTESHAADCAAVIYEHINYKGGSQCLQVGRYDLDDLALDNDTLSSVKVAGGRTVTLYEHENFAGAKKVVKSNTAHIGDEWNDTVSSIIVK